jgi:beta-galactosidase
VADAEGRFCAGESPLVQVSLEGPGKLAGMENGDLADCAEYSSPRRRMYRGRLIVYVLCLRESAEKTICTLTAEGLASASLAL